MFGSVGKKHRVIEAAPAGSPYAYLQAAVLQSDDIGALSMNSAVEEQHSPTSDAATDTHDLSTHVEDERYKADLYKSIYERRTGHAASQHDIATNSELLDRGKKINDEMRQREDYSSTDDAALEAHLLALEQRLVSRGELLRWGAVPEDQHPNHSSMSDYAKTRDVVLADKNRKAAEQFAREEESRLATERVEELLEMERYARDVIVVEILIRQGVQAYESAREARRDAEMMALIMADGERREASRTAQADELANNRAAREANYVQCADPVMRQMRQEAADRREAERLREQADEEAELQALEARLACLATGQNSGQPNSGGAAVTATSSVSNRTGATPYWKKQSVASTAPVNPAAITPAADSAGTPTMPSASTTQSPPPPLPRPSRTTPSDHLVDANEVSALLDVIDMAADDDSSNGNGIGRGLGLLLSGIRL
ncbi:Hypothetical protein, putative [Bodo saltans]|uniref:Uncharacterized protein n=1 Tax=Bodo saltans TaxID=75058 RepID=A0A0S4IUP0_BODSA|nr:Hypothetical protein, putative [Bodo saltans]|eukprot:CUF35754.1 Hypothetical protein, putative [Bodo saltans]